MTLDPNNIQQLSTVLEALQNPNHWGHAEAVKMAAEVAEKAHQDRIERGQKMMREQIDGMDETELAAFRRITD